MPAHRTRTETRDCDCYTGQRAHGTQHTYQVHRCGCDPCLDAYLAYLRELREARAAGRPVFVPVDPVRAHLHALSAAGHSVRLVAERLGYPPASLYSISRGARPTCRRETAEDVLSYPLPEGSAA